MAYNVLTGSIFRVPSSSLEITGTFAGDGGGLDNLPINQVTNAANTRLTTFTNAAGTTLNGEANLTFNGAVLNVTGEVTASVGVSASMFYGDGSQLKNVGNNVNSFATFAVSGQDNVVADSSTDTLTLAAGSNVTITTDAGSDTITIASSGGGGGGGSADAQGPTGSLQFQTGSGGISGSANVLYNFTNNYLTVNGGLVFNRTAVTTHHTAAANEFILGVNTSNPVSILFDASSFSGGQALLIKDEIGSASANNITLTASGGQTIDGASSIAIESPRASVNIYTDGSNWFIY
jgi:hypothetical protein